MSQIFIYLKPDSKMITCQIFHKAYKILSEVLILEQIHVVSVEDQTFGFEFEPSCPIDLSVFYINRISIYQGDHLAPESCKIGLINSLIKS